MNENEIRLVELEKIRRKFLSLPMPRTGGPVEFGLWLEQRRDLMYAEQARLAAARAALAGEK